MFRRLAEYAPPPSSVVSPEWLPPESFAGQRTLNVAIVGEPNVGKSTLVNRLLRRKVSAVSSKYNTTRGRVLGVLTEGPVQLVFYDTPGFVPEGGSTRHEYVAPLVTAAREAAEDADVVLFMVDIARQWTPDAVEALRRMAAICASTGAHLFVLANKIDLLKGVEASGGGAPDVVTLLAARRSLSTPGGGGGGEGAGTGTSDTAPPDADNPGVDGLIAGVWRQPPAVGGTEPPGEKAVAGDTSAVSQSAAVPAVDLGSLLPEDGNYACCWHPGDAEDVTAAATSATPAPPSGAATPGEPPIIGRDVTSEAASPHSAAPTPAPSLLLSARRGPTSASLPVLDRRLLRLAEDFEAAAFSAGLIGPSGFDDDGEAGGGGTSVASSPASRVYRLLPPVTPVCALRDPDGRLDRVRAVLQRLAPERPWEYNSRVHSDASQLDQVVEAVRERLLHHLHKCGRGPGRHPRPLITSAPRIPSDPLQGSPVPHTAGEPLLAGAA